MLFDEVVRFRTETIKLTNERVCFNEKGEDDEKLEQGAMRSGEDDRRLKQAATIGTALMVVNSHRALILM